MYFEVDIFGVAISTGQSFFCSPRVAMATVLWVVQIYYEFAYVKTLTLPNCRLTLTFFLSFFLGERNDAAHYCLTSWRSGPTGPFWTRQ